MDIVPEEVDFVREMRTRSRAEGNLFWASEGVMAIFDPEMAQKINALNFADMTLHDKLADVVRGRTSEPVSWLQVRAALSTQLRRLSDAENIGHLAARLRQLIEERLDQPLDLAWASQEICTRSLLPTVIAGLTPADEARVLRDQRSKLTRLMRTRTEGGSLWKDLQDIVVQVSAGSAVRRELRGRARGRRPRQLDLTDSMIEMLPELGIDRAVDAITAVLTAISGPPGAAAANLLLELTRRPEWAGRLTEELAPLAPEELYGAPAASAPVTHRFVKEVLRVWSPPLFLTRLVRTPLELGETTLIPGQRYLQSPYLMHHDPRHWSAPDTFDPDRWLSGDERSPCPHASYVPFGWAPKSCIGAGLGTSQLILLCHLFLTRYRIQVDQPESIRMILAAVPLPQGFTGTLTRR